VCAIGRKSNPILSFKTILGARATAGALLNLFAFRARLRNEPSAISAGWRLAVARLSPLQERRRACGAGEFPLGKFFLNVGGRAFPRAAGVTPSKI
jgi:hypothetical protein